MLDNLTSMYSAAYIKRNRWMVPLVGAHIPQAKLVMYPELGHSLYEEAEDYPDLVLDFLNH